MDNKLWSQIKRGLKVTVDYITTLLLFAIFSSIALSIFEDDLEKGIFIFSIILFLLMVPMIYTGMFDIAVREKRPQYKINPPPYKGFLYGIIGTIPIFLIQLIYYAVNLPEEYLTLKRRILQAITGPLYWLAKFISHDVWAYHLVLLVIPVIAGLGYLAGHYEFYIFRKLGIFNKMQKNKNIKKK